MPLVHWIPALAVAAGIFLLSHQSFDDDTALIHAVPDYLQHFSVYALFGASLAWGATNSWRKGLSARDSVLCVVAASLYGVSDEWHQSFVPNRVPSGADWLADTLGAALAIAALRAFLKRRYPTA